MEYQTGHIGRVFYLRFDHGDDLLRELTALIRKEDIQGVWFHLFGGLGAAGA